MLCYYFEQVRQEKCGKGMKKKVGSILYQYNAKGRIIQRHDINFEFNRVLFYEIYGVRQFLIQSS